jgi:signal transduction histidine kinase
MSLTNASDMLAASAIFGLGLAIARHIIDLPPRRHRRRESEGLGHGARFTVELPLGADAHNEPAGDCGQIVGAV